ncbi:STY1053 family phage-associated protein [Burkholderia cenocepacia]|uniref:STY1053 family phage-associated protein n=1 Tax=Burkholderia cenocepacia TaxID=95486 RepID=UPI002650DE4B|nr:hypothetical protein [Burkholderia cenocepacia]MDN7549083.1 hypothetical protein [Burkholderia cenocepacia]
MPKIYIKKAFKLLGDDGKHRDFPVGNHTVDKEVAEHWFVKAHTGEEPAADPNAVAAADELLAELDAKAKGLQELAEKLAEREKAADKRDAELAAREEAVAEREKAADAKQANKK